MDKETEHPGTTTGKTASEIVASPDFKRLVAKRWKVSGVLLMILFASYYGFILVVAVAKPFLAQKVGVVTTLGIPLGIGVIVIAFILTAIYVSWANASYDPEVQRLRDQLRTEK